MSLSAENVLGRDAELEFEVLRPLPTNAEVQSEHFKQMIDALPAAIYTTDAHGRLTHFNPACIALSGRVPVLGTNHWCVTWKLFHPDGRPMPHDECPMAVALKTGRVIQGAEAIAERPDGSRIWFTPYPTPLFDNAGNIIGGINMLVDITERKRAEADSARLAAIVASSEDAIISKTLDGTITSWNDSAQRIFGYSAEEAIGQPITMLIPPDRLDEEPRIIERLKRGERVDHIETRRRRKDGTLLDVSLTISPVRDGSGRIIGASKVARDITERKQAQEQIRRGAELLNTLIDRSPTGFYIVDADFRISHVNADSQARAFRNVNPAVGARLDDAMRILWPEPLATELIAIFRHTLDTGESYKSPGLVSPRADVDWTESYEWQLDRITMPDGRHAVVCYYYDTTRLREVEQALRNADHRKDEFLAMLSHELRNPLAPIRTGLEILRLAGNDRTLVEEVRTTMENQTQHLVRMVDDLLDVSRVTSGKIALRMERVTLASIVRSAVEIAQPGMRDAGHELSVKLPPEPVHLNGDSTRLGQILSNLLTNAARYTPHGGTIRLSAEAQEKEVVITVADNGIGIPQEMMGRIFEMFTQVDPSLERSQSGLGLGLALAKRLVELHGGAIEARSDGVGKGCEFDVRLPIATVQEQPRMALNNNLQDVPGDLRVLVVDDNVAAAKMLSLVVKVLGNEVFVAHDGLEAVAQVEAVRPDIVLMDIGMPRMNGYDAAKRIREKPWGKDVVLAALTGWGQDEDRQRTREAGFDHHLVKPVEPATITKLLRALSRQGSNGKPRAS